MPTIQIQQHPSEPRKATVSFAYGASYPIVITSPFADEQEQDLEWYFEEYLKFPFTHQVKFQQIAKSIKGYGENLFEQVFGQRKVYADYQAALAGQPTLEIIGSAAFHCLHWEALKDPDMAEPLAVRFNLIRKPVGADIQRQAISQIQTPVLRVLLVTSRPNGKHDVAYRTISQPLVAAVQNSRLPVQIDLLRPATYKALVQHLESVAKGTYHILHFDVHGSVLDYAGLQQGINTGAFLFDQHYGTSKLEPYDGKKAFLFLDGDHNTAQPIEAHDLKVLLARHSIPVVLLNACQSAKQSAQQDTSLGSLLMQAGIQGVVAMAYSVTVSAATLFVKTFYEQLLSHQDFSAAARRARFELHQDKNRKAYLNQDIVLEDWLLPVSYQFQPIQLPLRPFHVEEEAAWYDQQCQQYQPPHTAYGFVGRDLDVLEIEKRLDKDNLLLIQGMGGAGKTTLLHHLMNWWQVTHFVERVFYFGYDEKAHTCQQILHSIARRLFSEQDYKFRFQPFNEAAQQAKLVQTLRAQQHCIVLDNLESITGAALAIPHSLTAEQQAEIKTFLHALIGGKTRVLLGSRGEEAWLNCPTVYYLAGLDAEAASVLANKILERNHALHYRHGEQQADLLKLLKLLAGFPLALEVVLANLKQQTPKQVLQALQTGDEGIDFASEDKTQSILRCIDYSHSALSAQAQQLLLCLAPFKAVLYQPLLEDYSEKLQAQPALANLAGADWQSVLAELQNWGLISPHEVDGFISLQPTLSYFINHRLQQDEASLQAIQTAFREFYDDCGGQLFLLMNSKEPQEKQIGQYFTGLEYENLSFALQLALAAQVSIRNLYVPLSRYISIQQTHQQGLELGEWVLQQLDNYPPTLLQGQLGYDFVVVIDDIANRQWLLKYFAEAEQSYQKILSLVEILKNLAKELQASMQASIYHQLGIVTQEQRQWQQAEAYYHRALQIKVEFKDRYSQAITYHQLGAVAHAQKQWQQAHEYYQRALQIKVEFKDRYSQAITYHHLGALALAQKQWQQAEEHYQRSLQIRIEFKDRYSQAMTYHELGIVAHEQRQWQKAQDYYQHALQIKLEFNDLYSQAMTYHQLGSVVREQRQWQQAYEYYQRAIQINSEFNDNYSQAMTYHELGIMAEAQREWQQAQDYYQRALQIKIEFNDRYSQASTYGQLGNMAQTQSQWQQAQDYFLQALAIFIEFQDEYSLGITLGNLKRLYHAYADNTLAARISAILGCTEAQALKLLQQDAAD